MRLHADRNHANDGPVTRAPRRSGRIADSALGYDGMMLRRERCKRDFGFFIRKSFASVIPNFELVDDYYIDVLADHWSAFKRAMLGQPGGIRRIVFNLPPRSLKTTIGAVMFPAWCWLTDPWIPFLTAARDDKLAIRDSTSSRRLIQSPFYQSLISPDGEPEWNFAPDQNTKADFLNSKNGRRTATFRGGGTGYGGLGLIADDILSIDDRRSPIEITHANQWLREEFFTRQNDPARTAIALNMHRLSPDDPSAGAIERGWEHVCLPLEYDPADARKKTSIGWVDTRTEPGASLSPRRWTPAVIDELKGELGEFYEAVCNQRPRNRTGAILKDLLDLPRYKVLPVDALSRVSIDPSFKGFDTTRPKAKRSRVAIIDAWTHAPKLKKGEPLEPTRIYITSLICDYMHFDRLVAETKAARIRNHGCAIYLEDEANGPALRNAIEDQVPGIVPVDPGNGIGSGSKVDRFIAIAHFLKGGNVLFPEDDACPWVRPFIARILSYPNVEYDDDIDALTQLLRVEFLMDDGARKKAQAASEAAARWKAANS